MINKIYVKQNKYYAFIAFLASGLYRNEVKSLTSHEKSG